MKFLAHLVFCLFTTQVSVFGCTVKCNPCCDLVCPEVHVETSVPHCHMSTDAFDTHRPGCNIRYPSSSMLSLPPFPPLPHQPYGMHRPMCPYPYPPYPYPYPHPPQPAAPSYCVQSVVVGGKSQKEENNNVTTTTPRSRLPGPNLGSARGPLDPCGNPNNPNLRGNLQLPGNRSRECDRERYECYIERLLNVMKGRQNENLEASPMVVRADPVSPVRLRTIRRRPNRRYMMTDPDDDVLVEEEESPSYVIRPTCRGDDYNRRRRPCSRYY